MKESEQDKLIYEIHTDVRWLKEQHLEHKALHGKYVYYFITVLVACVLSWFK